MDTFPQDVKQFIEANIDSVAQLEILRFLAEAPEREWRAAALASEVQAHSIGHDLALLEQRGLLVTRTLEADLFCRYGPRTSELQDGMDHLLRIYRERPVTMINLVYAKVRRMPQTFVDVFRSKKDN